MNLRLFDRRSFQKLAFFSSYRNEMVIASFFQVRRLQTEKSTYEDELQKAKEQYRKQMHSMTVQCK